MEEREISLNEKKIRQITQMYYSRPEIQKAIFDFSKNREISPRYFEGFGKRPDSLQFKGDIFGLVKSGATSFHCSEELWEDPLKIQTGMSEKEANEIRIGWDLLIDIDCEEGMDYSARVAKATIEALKQNGIKNIGIKFSGSKGFHIILPWKAFPKNINGVDTKDLFPELPRTIMAYLRNYSRKAIQKDLPNDFYEKFKDKIKKGRHKCKKCGNFVEEFLRVEFQCQPCGIVEERSFEGGKGQLPKCYKCKNKLSYKPLEKFFICQKCEINSRNKPDNFELEEVDLYKLMELDMGLVSPRHLFRMPYSLHEKSSLASVVIEEKDLEEFIKDPNYAKKIADPLRIKVKNFMPEVEENEAAEFVMQAFDWAEDSGFNKESKEKATGKYANYKAIKLENVKESQFPPCVKKILEGMQDGKKRGLFILINLFRSIGMEKEELEKRIYEWNEKNEVPLKKGYINSQLVWTYRRKPIMPQNCKEFYQNLGVCKPNNMCSKIKNPVNYLSRKNFIENKNSK
ncbi:hypothetical protein HOD29_03570 [archaeon]|jgi:hypothetical protein|nr:hypothetical protein [archaeon]